MILDANVFKLNETKIILCLLFVVFFCFFFICFLQSNSDEGVRSGRV